MSLCKPKAVFAASERHYTAAGGEVQVPRGGIYCTNDGRWSKEIDSRTGKTNGVLHELYALWSQNRSFQTPQSCQFFNLSLFRSLSMAISLG